MRTKTILALLSPLPLLSFVLNPVVFMRQEAKINQLLILSPACSVSNIEHGGKWTPDKEKSRQLFTITRDALKKFFPDSINNQHLATDSITQSKVDNFIIAVNNEITSDKRAAKYIVPDSIVSLFDSTRANFVLCTYTGGFIRTRKNLIKSYESSQAANVLFGYNRRPAESGSFTSCFIIDLARRNIAYFERKIWKEKDPTEKTTIDLQLSSIIHHFMP